MKNIFIFFGVFLPTILICQTPFTTTVKEQRVLKKIKNNNNEEVLVSLDQDIPADKKLIKKIFNNKSLDKGEETKKENVDFFSNNSLAVNLVSKGLTRTSITSKVIHYKLYVATPAEEDTDKLDRYNVPLLVIAKLSSSYDTINSSSALDVLDYEAAPLTIRTMPSFKVPFEKYSDVLYWGFYADLRGINIYNPDTNDNSVKLIGSGGIGLTFQGDGAAGTYNNKGEYEQGKYSISIILQGAYGKKNVMGKLFNTNLKHVGSIQGFFTFKASKSSNLSIKVGYLRMFQKTLSGKQQSLSIALGI